MASDKIKILNVDTFLAAIEQGTTPVLVDFWAPWCGPCKALAPVLDELAESMAGRAHICKLDVDDNQEIAAKYQIRAIPTLLIFKENEVVEQIVGPISHDDLKAKLEAHV